MNYPPNAPPPGGYGGPPPGGYGPPPGGYGGPPPGYPGMPGMMPGMMPGGPMMAGAPYGIDPLTGLPFSDKQKTVAGLLQLLCFIGIGGVGRLYTGHIGMGIAQLLLGPLTCGIWPLVDAILMFTGKVTDAQGRPLRD